MTSFFAISLLINDCFIINKLFTFSKLSAAIDICLSISLFFITVSLPTKEMITVDLAVSSFGKLIENIGKHVGALFG